MSMNKLSHNKIVSVPYIDQSVRYPTGCESVSTVMLLQYLGYPLTVDDFITNYLPMQNFETRNGELYGPDPNQVFCGSPYDPDSFGCYAPVIENALNHVFRSKISSTGGRHSASGQRSVSGQYQAVNETGTPVSELLTRYIDHDMPVIFWASIEMREPIIGPAWKRLDDGSAFTWISNEHCMLLVGYDDENLYFNDPYDNHGCIPYPRDLAENRHAAQYEMAVGVRVL